MELRNIVSWSFRVISLFPLIYAVMIMIVILGVNSPSGMHYLVPSPEHQAIALPVLVKSPFVVSFCLVNADTVSGDLPRLCFQSPLQRNIFFTTTLFVN